MTLRRRLPSLIVLSAVAASLVTGIEPAATATEVPQKVWQRDIPGGSIFESAPALVDLDGDGALDVVVGARDSRIHAFAGRDGANVAGWPQGVSDRVDSSPSFADVDGDGQPELFVGAGMHGDRNGAFYSFTTDGRVRYRRLVTDPVHPGGAPVRTAPAIGDIDGDRALDVTTPALAVHSLWSFRGVDGAPLTGDELFNWDDTMFSSAALADVDGDGRLDVIVGGDSTPGGVVDHRGGMVRAISGDGRVLWTYFTDDIVRSSPSVGDIDGDGRLEAVFGGGDYWHGADAVRVHAVDAATGAREWVRDTDGVTNGSPALADVTGDGRLDVAIGTFDSLQPRRPGGTVYVLDGVTGGNAPGWPQPSGAGAQLGGIVTADLNADGAQDLIVPTFAFIAVFDGRSGQKLYNLGDGELIGFHNSPAIADVDGNGRLDLLTAGLHVDGTGRVTRWELPAQARLGALGWHQFRKDGRRTGSWTSTVPPAATIGFRRIEGDDRYGTAAALAPSRTGGTVLVAIGTEFADALAGGPAAADGLLLVRADEIPTDTRRRLGELRPQEILVLGGRAKVSDAVVAELRDMAPSVERVGGDNRFETAAAISARAFPGPAPEVAYIATGREFPDALAGAAAGARRRGPVLLVESDSLPPETAAELRRLSPRSIEILGGDGRVSPAVEAELRAYAPSVRRHAGLDRYATAVLVSRTLFPNGASTAYLATGETFPDALAGGPAAAAAGAPLLLVRSRCMPNVVRAELDRLGVSSVVLLGGRGAVSGAVAALTPC